MLAVMRMVSGTMNVSHCVGDVLEVSTYGGHVGDEQYNECRS